MIPNIPSDNLYKAATFTGAALLVIGVIGPVFTLDRLNTAQVALLKDLNDSNGKLYLAMPAKADKAEQATSKRDELLELVKQNHETHKNWLNEASSQKLQLDNTFLWSLRVGSGFFIGGVFFWWRNVQAHQDRILKAEASKLTGAPEPGRVE